MNLKELVVCKFTGCNQVFNDPRFLPCGHRTCAAHIEVMILKSDGTSSDRRMMIKCHFCQRIHKLPDDGDEFPRDTLIPMLLNIKHCSEHDAAKKSFNDVAQLLRSLTKFNEEDYVKGYFERVEADILLEKEVNIQKLIAHYQKLVDEVREYKVKCLHSLKTNKRLDSIRQTLLDYEAKLKEDNVEFTLKTLDGDQAKWKKIQSEFDSMLEKARSLEEELKERIVDDQMIRFLASESQIPIESMCGQLVPGTIDSTILSNGKMKYDLVELCKLGGKQFKLLYRASRDGFDALSFHAKCDHQPSTLTVIKTTKGYIFGGFTALAWESIGKHKADPSSFLFSLINHTSMPQLMPLQAVSKHSIFCDAASGPSFGGGCDLYISDISNVSTSSYSNLGHSYDFTLFFNGTTEAKSFLAGSYKFQTSEIEVFQLS